MGGKSKTYTDLGVAKVYDPADNLFFKDILRLVALNGGRIDPFNIMSSILRNSSAIFNFEGLKGYGIVSEVSLTSESFDPALALQYIQTNLDSTANYIYYWNACTNAYSPVEKFTEYLDNVYTRLSDTSAQTFRDKFFDEDGYYWLVTRVSPTYLINGQARIILPWSYTDAYGTWTVPAAGDLPPGSSAQCTVGMYLEGNINDVIWVEIDNTTYYYYVKASAIPETKIFTVRLTDVLGLADTQKVIMLPFKKNFVDYLTAQNTIAASSAFGFRPSDMQSAVEKPELKDLFLTLAGSINSQFFESLLFPVYGSNTAPRYVSSINGPYPCAWSCEQFTVYGDSGLETQIVYYVNINGISKEIAVDENFFLLPISLNSLKNIPFKNRYAILKEMLSLIGASSVTVDIPWYQTGWFRAVVLIIVAYIAAITAPGSGGTSTKFALAFMEAYVVAFAGMVLTDIFGKDAKWLMAVYTIYKISQGEWTGETTTTTAFNYVSNLSTILSTISSIYFQTEIDELQASTAEINAKDEKAKEELKKLIEDSSMLNIAYNTHDRYSKYYETLYKLPDIMYENAFNMAETAFSYNNIFDKG